jgi:hypothetical protein
MSDDNRITRFGDKVNTGGFKKGPDPRRNPGGKISLANDLKRAQVIGIPAEIQQVLDEWADTADKKLAELGPVKFMSNLRAAVQSTSSN